MKKTQKNKLLLKTLLGASLLSNISFNINAIEINILNNGNEILNEGDFIGIDPVTKIQLGQNSRLLIANGGGQFTYNGPIIASGNSSEIIIAQGDIVFDTGIPNIFNFIVEKAAKIEFNGDHTYAQSETGVPETSTLVINSDADLVFSNGINYQDHVQKGGIIEVTGKGSVTFEGELGSRGHNEQLTEIKISNKSTALKADTYTDLVTLGTGGLYFDPTGANAVNLVGKVQLVNNNKGYIGVLGNYDYTAAGLRAFEETLLVNNAQNFTKTIGVGDGGTINIADGEDLVHKVVTNQDGKGILNLTGDRVIGRKIGNRTSLQRVNFKGLGGAADATIDVKANIFANEIKLEDMGPNGHTLNFGNAIGIKGKITTDTNDRGILNLTGDRGIEHEIGEVAAKLKEVNFKGDGGAADATIDVKANIFANEIKLEDMGPNGHTLKFADNAGFGGQIKTSGNDEGVIEFSGNGDVGAIGAKNLALKSITFADNNGGNAVRRLAGDIWVGKADFDAGKFQATKNISINSQNITIDGSEFDVGGNTIVFDGGHGPAITINGNIVFNVGDGGSVVFQDSGAITVNAGSITANVTGPYNAAPITFNNILGNASQVTVNNQNQQNPQPQQNKAQQQNRPAAGGAAAAGAAAAKQQQTPVSINQIPELVKDRVTKESLTRIVEDLDDISKGKNISNTAERDEFVHNIETLSVEQVKQYVDQVVDFTNTLKEELIFEHRGLAQEVSSVLESRMTELTAPISAAPIVAPAAGDEDPRNGVWIGGFAGNNANKKGLKTKNNFSGASIGYERFVNDTDAVGFAITNIRSNSKYGSSIKNTSNNFIASLYGFTDINGLILSGSIFGGQGKFKSSRDVVSAGGGLTAKGNFKSRIYGAQGGMAYQIMQDQHVITPSFGLQYSAITQGKYKETGAGVSNREIGKKSSSVLIGTFATKYGYIIQNDNTIVIPSIQVGVASELSAKSSNVKTKFLWQEQANSFKADTKRQTRLFVTPSISAKSDAFDFSLAYTFDKAKKATGHMVALKLMTKF